MKLKLEIEMDNAAFEDQQGAEVARILHKLADQLDGNVWLGGLSTRLIDFNGNVVGVAKTTKGARP
jgi:hypothetical protein